MNKQLDNLSDNSKSSDDIELIISPTGTIQCIHSDPAYELLSAIFPTKVKRAGNVEPDTTQQLTWTVDLAPLLGEAGPCILATAPRREEALAIEKSLVQKFIEGERFE